ncbi:MAG: hypothetical protein IJ587_10995 [Synergistaceae bacterium]|nr:hypothetical protein [Synergistaceae bacterium]
MTGYAMMSEFSKGKWRNEGHWIVADNIPIAEVCTEYDEGMTYSEQSERLRNANARLIAAAPEMYQHLKLILNGEFSSDDVEQLLARIDGDEQGNDDTR